MLKIKKILCPMDFSKCSRQALEHALFLTGEYNAELHLMHIVELGSSDPYDPSYLFPGTEELSQKVKTAAKKRLYEVAETIERQKVVIKIHQSRGISAAFSILEHARKIDADLIVCGTRGRKGWDFVVMGSVTSRILRYAECPVLTIHETRTSRDPEAVDKVLVPYDFSDHSRVALDHAVELATTYRTRLDLLHVVDIRKDPDFYHENRTRSLRAREVDIQERARKRLEEIAEEVRARSTELGKVQAHICTGREWVEIGRFAEEVDSDIIVIATHGQTDFRRILLGSVAEKVIRDAECPVFCVHAYGKSLLPGR